VTVTAVAKKFMSDAAPGLRASRLQHRKKELFYLQIKCHTKWSNDPKKLCQLRISSIPTTIKGTMNCSN